MPPYFLGLLCLLGWAGGGGRRYSVYGGEGGLLCRPISWACSAYWGAGGDPTLSTGLRGTYSTPLFRGLLCILGCGVGGGDATLSTGVRGAYSAHLFRVSRPPSPP